MSEQSWTDDPITGVDWGLAPTAPVDGPWGPPPEQRDPWDVPPPAFPVVRRDEPVDLSKIPVDEEATAQNRAQHVSSDLVEATGAAVAFYRDPDEVSRLAGELSRQLTDLVQTAHEEVRRERPVNRVTAETVAPELRVLADAATTLDALGKALVGAAKLARDTAGEVLLEVKPDDELRTATVKAGDGHGRTLKVTRTQPTDVSAKPDEVVDVLAPWLESRVSNSPAVAAGYMRGAREGIAAWRNLVGPPKFKSTALEALAADMDNAGEHALAIRLGHAWGRVAKGEARTTVERIESKGE